MDLTRFPRVRLAHAPTPLEPLDNLSRLLGGPRIWIKRDDCTGLAIGGNKTRKLEFLVGAALAEGADTLITQGAVQSNHVRQTAAAAGKCGLACEIVLEERVAEAGVEYREGGNVLLDRLLGVDARSFARALAVARYAPPAEAVVAGRRVRQELRGLRRAIRGRLGVPSRLRGAVSLRSLAT